MKDSLVSLFCRCKRLFFFFQGSHVWCFLKGKRLFSWSPDQFFLDTRMILFVFWEGQTLFSFNLGMNWLYVQRGENSLFFNARIIVFYCRGAERRLATRSWLFCLLSVFSQKNKTYREKIQNKWSCSFDFLLLEPKIWISRTPSALIWFVGFVLRACHCFRRAGNQHNQRFRCLCGLICWGAIGSEKGCLDLLIA